MKHGLTWLLVTGLITLSLVLVSCGPSTPQEPTPPTTPPAEIPTYTNPLNPGESARNAEIVVTISEAKLISSYQYDSETKQPAEGSTFLIVTVKVENISTQVQREGGYKMRAVDAAGNMYSVKPYFGADRFSTDYQLTAGGMMQGKVLFEIPKGTTGLKIRYLATAFFPPVTLADWTIQ